MIIDIKIPITMKIKVSNILINESLVFKIMLYEFGKRSVRDTQIMTPAANDKEIVTILLFFLLSINIIRAPITVDIPAIKDKIKAYIVLFDIKMPPKKIYASHVKYNY